jgi:hypothetical protein
MSMATVGNGPNIEMTDSARMALRAYGALAIELEGIVGPHGLTTSRVASSLLGAAGAVVAATLPGCPFAPAGVAVQPDWDPVSHNYMMRCQHPGHCWDNNGNYYACP